MLAAGGAGTRPQVRAPPALQRAALEQDLDAHQALPVGWRCLCWGQHRSAAIAGEGLLVAGVAAADPVRPQAACRQHVALSMQMTLHLSLHARAMPSPRAHIGLPARRAGWQASSKPPQGGRQLAKP